jgi:hypothetical protein
VKLVEDFMHATFRIVKFIGAAGLAWAAVTAGSAAQAATAASSWGKARELPGTASLNTGGEADSGPLSCSSDGNCSVGGYYKDGAGNLQAQATCRRTSSRSHSDSAHDESATPGSRGDAAPGVADQPRSALERLSTSGLRVCYLNP